LVIGLGLSMVKEAEIKEWSRWFEMSLNYQMMVVRYPN